MKALISLIVYISIETPDTPFNIGLINVLTTLCSTVSKLAGQRSCLLRNKLLYYLVLNLRIYYPFLLKVGLSD